MGLFGPQEKVETLLFMKALTGAGGWDGDLDL